MPSLDIQYSWYIHSSAILYNTVHSSALVVTVKSSLSVAVSELSLVLVNSWLFQVLSEMNETWPQLTQQPIQTIIWSLCAARALHAVHTRKTARYLWIFWEYTLMWYNLRLYSVKILFFCSLQSKNWSLAKVLFMQCSHYTFCACTHTSGYTRSDTAHFYQVSKNQASNGAKLSSVSAVLSEDLFN